MTDSEEGGALAVLVVDDEAPARRRLVELLRPRTDVRVVGECSNGREALAAVRELRPDLLFLDVQMPGYDGFEVLARLDAGELPAVVFSTAYDEYALAAFDVHAVDYLLKPYADERLEEALDRAKRHVRARHMDDLRDRLLRLLDDVAGPRTKSDDPPFAAPKERYRERFAVRSNKGATLVATDSVEWIEARGDYAALHAGDGTHLLRATMTELEQTLDPDRFIRIHRSTIVRMDRVRSLATDDHGDYVAVLEGGRELRVGRTYRDAVLRRFGLR